MFVLSILAACTKNTSDAIIPSGNNTMLLTDPARRTWLALGDSYTIGQGVEEKERFPAQAMDLLTEKNISIDTLRYIAGTGWTSLELQMVIQQFNPSRHGVVTLQIGVNDQYRRWDTSGYRPRFTDLLEKAIQLTGGKPERVLVLSIPDYSATPYARRLDTVRIRKEIDIYNQINRSVTESKGSRYYDITQMSKQALNNPKLICGDSLHPSGIEYRRWAELIVPAMEEIFK